MGDTQAASSSEPSAAETVPPPAIAALIIGTPHMLGTDSLLQPLSTLEGVVHVGMAGSGKTSLVHRISQHIQASSKAENYVINLDPAVHTLPYHANIDIRDTVRSCNVSMYKNSEHELSWKASKQHQAAQPTSATLQVNYKNVMKEYKLGPNGGILTSCNLFATRFDQV